MTDEDEQVQEVEHALLIHKEVQEALVMGVGPWRPLCSARSSTISQARTSAWSVTCPECLRILGAR